MTSFCEYLKSGHKNAYQHYSIFITRSEIISSCITNGIIDTYYSMKIRYDKKPCCPYPGSTPCGGGCVWKAGSSASGPRWSPPDVGIRPASVWGLQGQGQNKVKLEFLGQKLISSAIDYIQFGNLNGPYLICLISFCALHCTLISWLSASSRVQCLRL